MAGGLYLVSGSLASGFGRRLSMTRAVRLHLSSLAAVFLVLLGIGAWLNRAEHLLEPTTLLFGASYADVMGRMPAGLLLVAACVVGAALAMVQAFTTRNWPIPAAVGLYLLVSVGGELYSSAMQRFIVAPNEQTRESPYIQHNIDATRRAFGLDGVEERELSGDALLTPADIGRNAATRSTTCGCGITSRCSKPSGRFRRSAPTTTSARWTTTATAWTGSCAR